MLKFLKSATKPVVNSNEFLQASLDRLKCQPNWAKDLPPDPTTIHMGSNPKAAAFQEEFSRIDHVPGWGVSHVCILTLLNAFHAELPRRYLEIGVCEGMSLFALVTGIRLQKLGRHYGRPEPANLDAPILDELVLADSWQNRYGGTGKGSNAHIRSLLKALDITMEKVTFLDGDSKQTVPAFLKALPGRPPFDAVYVDGDHSYDGAKTDLENVLPYVGNMLFFDDIYHPAHCLSDRLLELHRSMVQRLKNDFYVFVNRHWFGFAAFIRKDAFDRLIGV